MHATQVCLLELEVREGSSTKFFLLRMTGDDFPLIFRLMAR